MDTRNAKTGMTHEGMKQFILNHVEEFVNKQNLAIADVNFAWEFLITARMCRSVQRRGQPERSSTLAEHTNAFPTFM